MKKYNIISLFDGCSGGHMSLDRAGIPINNYYASEIDKYAIIATKHYYPDTIHLGDIEKWREWEIDWSSIDIVLGGSPCQGFSKSGKGLNFEDPRSKLFFAFVDILNHVKSFNPEVKFLLENVEMVREWQNVISKYMGINPIMINSALVSAQARKRLYWTNFSTEFYQMFGGEFCNIPQPEDRFLFLKDILEDQVDEKYYLSEKALQGFFKRSKKNKEEKRGFDANFSTGEDKSATITSHYGKDGKECLFINRNGVKSNQQKAACFTAGAKSGGHHSDMDLLIKFSQSPDFLPGGKNEVIQINPSTESGGIQPYQQNRIYYSAGKAPSLSTDPRPPAIIQRERGNNTGGLFEDKSPNVTKNSWEQNNHLSDGIRIRRLTPKEVCRLQTVDYDLFLHKGKQIVSDTQIYKMMGNGWNIDTVAHIMTFLNIKK